MVTNRKLLGVAMAEQVVVTSYFIWRQVCVLLDAGVGWEEGPRLLRYPCKLPASAGTQSLVHVW